MAEQKSTEKSVSKRMMVVIVAMLLIITVPVSVMVAPWSKIVLTITNTNPDNMAEGLFSIIGAGISDTSFNLGPGQGEEWTFNVNAGRCTVAVRYMYFDWYYDHLAESVIVPFLGTGEVHISLSNDTW